MFKILFILIISFSICTAQTDLNGLWSDSNSTAFKNCYLIISQTNDKITIAHYIEYNGQPLVEKGNGEIKENEIQYTVEVTKGIPGWAKSGSHYLKINKEGNILRGYYIDAKGNKGPLVFKKVI